MLLTISISHTEVEIINISEKPQQSHGTLHKVKRRVSLLLGELVYYVVRRRQRIRRTSDLCRGGIGIEYGMSLCIAMIATDFVFILDNATYVRKTNSIMYLWCLDLNQVFRCS